MNEGNRDTATQIPKYLMTPEKKRRGKTIAESRVETNIITKDIPNGCWDYFSVFYFLSPITRRARRTLSLFSYQVEHVRLCEHPARRGAREVGYPVHRAIVETCRINLANNPTQVSTKV